MYKKYLRIMGWILFSLLGSATFAMFLFAPEYSKFNNSMLVASMGFLLIIGYFDRKRIFAITKSSFFKHLINNLITIFLIFSILGLTNYLVYKNSKDFDLSEKKFHTLSDQSRNVVSNFKDEVEITLFAKRADWNGHLSILRQYKQENPNFTIHAIDVEADPALAKLNQVKEDGSVVIKYQGKLVKGKADSELKITNLLLKLIRDKQLTILYTKGHGEVKFEDTGREGGSYLLERLREFNYNVGPLDLLAITDIPTTVDVVMLMGPANGLLDLEIDKLKRYLSKGGNLLVTLGPNFQKTNWGNIYGLLQDNGIRPLNTIVLDRLATVQGSRATIPLISNFNDAHNITDNFEQRVIFPLVSSLELLNIENIKTDWLARTSNFPASWAETNLEEVATGKAQFDEKDFKGPITVAAVSRHQSNASKIAVLGSSSLVVNGYQAQSANFNFFINILTWLMDDEGIIALNRPSLQQEKVFLGSSQITLIFWVSIIFIPFIFFGIGIYFYRRKLQK